MAKYVCSDCGELASNDRTHISSTGAKSSPVARFDLIPSEALARLAGRYKMGLMRYGKDNWRKGISDPEYVKERLAHAVGHIYALIDQIDGRLPWEDDDHAAALMWAGAFACVATEPDNDLRQARGTS